MRGRQFEDVPRIRPFPAPCHGNAVLHQEVRHRRDVGEHGHILQGQGFRCQQRRSHQRQRRILGAADRDYPFERNAALDADLVHCLGPTRRQPTPSRYWRCLYWRPGHRSSRRLLPLWRCLGQPALLVRARLLLSLAKIFAQRFRQPFFAGCALAGFLCSGGLRILAHAEAPVRSSGRSGVCRFRLLQLAQKVANLVICRLGEVFI